MTPLPKEARMRIVRSLRPTLALAAALGSSAAALAGTVEKTVPFALDQWIELASTDGPVTLHRLRLVRQGGVTKSTFMRPGNNKYLADVQIQLEFTNDSTNDWEARFEVEWVDGDGKVIDGYEGDEGLDSEQRHEQQTVTLSTLKYGIDKAKKLKIRITTNPD
jgi:hypothetical protein